MKLSIPFSFVLIICILAQSTSVAKAQDDPCHHINAQGQCCSFNYDHCWTPFPSDSCKADAVFEQTVTTRERGLLTGAGCSGPVYCVNSYDFEIKITWICEDNSWKNKCSRSHYSQATCNAEIIRCPNCPSKYAVDFSIQESLGNNNSCIKGAPSAARGMGVVGTDKSYEDFHLSIAEANVKSNALSEIVEQLNYTSLVAPGCSSKAGESAAVH